MASGPPSHCALNRGGAGGSRYEVRLSRTPHLETLLRSNRGAQPVTGSTTAATALRHRRSSPLLRPSLPCADLHRRTSEGRELLRRSDVPTFPFLSLSLSPTLSESLSHRLSQREKNSPTGSTPRRSKEFNNGTRASFSMAVCGSRSGQRKEEGKEKETNFGSEKMKP